MKYSKFGKQDWVVSISGLGMMHLPLLDWKSAEINEFEAIKMVHYAVDHGINYIDLGWPLEIKNYKTLLYLVNRALQENYRSKVRLAAYLPSVMINSIEDCDRCLNLLLKWLQTDRVDYYLLGALDRNKWPALKQIGVLHWAEKAMAEGRIGQLGFGFHDEFRYLQDIINDYDNWTLCQFRYSYLDIDHHPGLPGIRYAASKGLSVVVTEPLRGGRLTQYPPEPVSRLWDSAPTKRSLAEWGLRWVWNHPEISTVVSNVSSLQQLKETISLASNTDPGTLTPQEEALISQVREAYRSLKPLSCTTCRSCLPCPQGIDAPRILEIYNDAVMFDDIEFGQSLYRKEKLTAEVCNGCGICVQRCPQRINIPEMLRKVEMLIGEFPAILT
jgi:predicted aldo/keto reductase-like oxidoreductase